MECEIDNEYVQRDLDAALSALQAVSNWVLTRTIYHVCYPQRPHTASQFSSGSIDHIGQRHLLCSTESLATATGAAILLYIDIRFQQVSLHI